MSDKYSVLSNSSSIVVIGFEVENAEFKAFVQAKGIDEEYNLEDIGFPFEVVESSGAEITDEQMEELMSTSPLFGYKSKTLKVLVNKPNEQLVIMNSSMDETGINITKEILNLKSFDVRAIGLNFEADFVLKDNKKLKLLNPQLENLEDWGNNKTFILKIPFQYTDYSATYTVQKLIPTDENKEQRAYKINANFDFVIGKTLGIEKMSRINDVLNNYKNSLNEFNNRCEQLLEFCYE